MARVRINSSRKIAFAHRVTRPHVSRTSALILQAAKRMVPRGSHASGSGDRRPGQPLSIALHTSSHASTYEIRDQVGSRNSYAATVHQGSKAHWIQSRGGKMLKFQWERGNLLVQAKSRGRIRGRVPRSRNGYFFFIRVRHPGNKRPVRYLTTPMNLYGKMRGFRVTSTPASRTRLP